MAWESDLGGPLGIGDPGDVAQAAARAVTEVRRTAGWVEPGLAHESLCLLEMRLRDLLSTNAPARTQRSRARGANIVVRSPTLP